MRSRARVQIAAATLSGNSLRQTAHTHCVSVHQAAKLVAALLMVARVTAGQAESNGSLYRRVHDSRHLHADCHKPGSAPGPEPYARQSSTGYLYLFTFLLVVCSNKVSILHHFFDTTTFAVYVTA